MQNISETSSRSQVTKILHDVYPDINIDDEEALFARILLDYGAYADLIDKTEDDKRAEAALEAEYTHNMATSMAEIEKMRVELNIDGEVIDQAIDMLKAIARDTEAGNYTTDNIDMMLKIISRQADIDKAHADGVIEGRNASIEIALAKPAEGDGLPVLAGANNAAGGNRHHSIFDMAYAAK